MDEKALFVETRQSSAFSRTVRIAGVTLLGLGALVHLSRPLIEDYLPAPFDSNDSARCVQHSTLVPPPNAELDANIDVIYSPEYRNKSVQAWSGLVRVKSESFDDNGDVEGDNRDPRWDVFYDVESYLRDTFPLVHERLDLEKVNTHGLVYTWKGSDETLKPGMYMAHQDTVPVNMATVDDWTHPPWSGYDDGERVWGRGACDCKHQLSSLLESVTLLLEKGFVPKRTIILAFGFDEESKGWNGAGTISTYLEQTYGKDSMAFIIDEGGLGIGEMYGTPLALPSTGEKGYVDVSFKLKVPGGHSSVPPDHTSIGMMSKIVTKLEKKPFQPSLSTRSPVFDMLECIAEHGRLSSDLKSAVGRSRRRGAPGERARRQLAKVFASIGRVQKALITTTQAVDVMNGGVKVNALPETTTLKVNHRISLDSSVESVKEHYRQIVPPIARRFGLELDLFGHHVKPHHGCSHADDEAAVPAGKLVVDTINDLEPAPITPITTPQWAMFSGTIKHIYNKRFTDKSPLQSAQSNPDSPLSGAADSDLETSKSKKPTSQELIVSPGTLTGNTDTRFMWNLSRNIWRFTPIDRDSATGIHTVDESLTIKDHIDAVAFFHELIRNADAANF